LTDFLSDPAKFEDFARGFFRSDAPPARAIALKYRPTLKPLPSLPSERDAVALLKAEKKRRRIIDRLPSDRRRAICAFGRLIAVAYRARAENESSIAGKELEKAIAIAIIAEMRALVGRPRLHCVRALVRAITERRLDKRKRRREELSPREMETLARYR
jgi:hypothetical protein